MLESIAEGILEISSERIVYANSAAVGMTGIPIEELLNSNPLNIFDDAARRRVAEMLNSDRETPMEIGIRKPVELNNRLVTLKLVLVKEVPSSNIMLITDVTSRIQMEVELQHARKMEAIGTIASGVAHNFRNTLAGILANSQVIQMNYQNDEKLNEIIDRINSSIHRGEQLVNSLLEFSYKEIKKEFRPVDLVPLIQATYQLLQASFDKRINIHIKVPDALFVLDSAAF
jgi:signal transduction histidine kinase